MRTYALPWALALALCAGCLSVDRASVNAGREEHLVVRNYGWSLFNGAIPLCCGNVDADATCPVALFSDDVTVEKIKARYVRETGGRAVATPVFVARDTKFISVFGIPIPYVICYKDISLSGTLK